MLGTWDRDQYPFSIILHSTTVLYYPPPTDLTRREGRRAFEIHVLACVCFSLLIYKFLEDQNQDFISLSPQSLKHFMKGNTCRMNGHLQRLRIKYLTFSSNPEVIVGLSGSQNVGKVNLPSSIFPQPTPRAEEVQGSLWTVCEFLGSGTALCSQHLPQPPHP